MAAHISTRRTGITPKPPHAAWCPYREIGVDARAWKGIGVQMQVIIATHLIQKGQKIIKCDKRYRAGDLYVGLEINIACLSVVKSAVRGMIQVNNLHYMGQPLTAMWFPLPDSDFRRIRVLSTKKKRDLLCAFTDMPRIMDIDISC
jgi:hypothetical protein